MPSMLHNEHVSLGINRRVYLDWVGFPGLIDYRTLKTAREAYDYFKSLGVTHLVELPGHGCSSKQEEIFADLLHYSRQLGAWGEMHLWEMPATPPPAVEPYRVLTLGAGAAGTASTPSMKSECGSPARHR